MTAKIHTENSGGKHRSDAGYRPVNRSAFLIGLTLSLLIHAIGFWLLFYRTPLMLKTPSAKTEGRLTISLAPPAAPARPSIPPAPAPKPQKESPPVARKKPQRKPLITAKRAPLPASKPTTSVSRPESDSQPARPAPAEDMFTQLQAARKRRAEAQAQAGIPEPPPAPQPQERANDDNSIALANVATSLNRARHMDKDESGGVFQLRRVGYDNAEFLFRGWSTRVHRNTTRLVTVDQGSDIDIQTAVVKKMIGIIREEKTDTFIWESHRLGKSVTLSAKPQDSAALQQFLLREFFPDYPAASSGR